MKRLLVVLLVACLTSLWASCGNVFVGGGFQPGQSSLTGAVSFVEVNTVVWDGASIEVTLVSFLQEGFSSSLTFCGDQSGQFPIDQTVTMNFTPGQPCATLVTVFIVG